MYGDCSKKWMEFFHKNYSEKELLALKNTVLASFEKEECYPPFSQIFNAFHLCEYENIRLVIIGQDPYHAPNQAQGLAFSVPNKVALPPSLKNIFIELSTDLHITKPTNGDLSNWAKQGVLLLNTALSVQKSKPGSHLKIWNSFTKTIIKALSKEKSKLIFILWGEFAQKYEILIDTSKHYVLKTGHPSPLSANRGYWFGNKHFSKINAILHKNGDKEINWILD
jgi:uracil-DNA glycosylase